MFHINISTINCHNFNWHSKETLKKVWEFFNVCHFLHTSIYRTNWKCSEDDTRTPIIATTKSQWIEKIMKRERERGKNSRSSKKKSQMNHQCVTALQKSRFIVLYIIYMSTGTEDCQRDRWMCAHICSIASYEMLSTATNAFPHFVWFILNFDITYKM